MPLRLDTRDAGIAASFRAFLDTKREVSADVDAAVRAIIADVIARGDQALIDFTKRFDRLDLDASRIRIGDDEIAAAAQACDAETLAALTFARDRIEAYHRRQLPADERFTDAAGVE